MTEVTVKNTFFHRPPPVAAPVYEKCNLKEKLLNPKLFKLKYLKL